MLQCESRGLARPAEHGKTPPLSRPPRCGARCAREARIFRFILVAGSGESLGPHQASGTRFLGGETREFQRSAGSACGAHWTLFGESKKTGPRPQCGTLACKRRLLPIDLSLARNDEPESLSEHGPEKFRGRSNRKAMKVLSRDTLSFQSKTTSFSYFGREIKSMGKRPSERRHQELSVADWMGLEIAELVGLSVAKSEATCLFVLLSQPDVLREFPALPTDPKSPSTERPDLMTVLHNEIEAKGATLTQAEARICPEGRRDRGPKNSRGPQNFGRVKHNVPKGPRKNRADE